MFIRLIGAVATALSIAAGSARAQGTDTVTNHGSMRGMAAMPGMSTAHRGDGIAVLVAPSGAKAPSGMAMVNGTTVELMLSGDEPGSKRVWHAHKGTCAHDEGMIGHADAYPPLMIGLNGKGRAKVKLDSPLADGSTYFVAVHISATDMKSIVACSPVQARKM